MNLAVWVGVRSQVEIYQFPEIFCLLIVHQKESELMSRHTGTSAWVHFFKYIFLNR